MAKFSTVLNTSTPANLPAQMRQLFVDAALESWSVGALIDGTNCKYFVLLHMGGAELLVQVPINTSTTSFPTFYSTSGSANYVFTTLASHDSPESMWDRLYVDELLPNNASFWTGVTGTPSLWFPEIITGQGDSDFEVYLRDDENDFDMIWLIKNEGSVSGIKGGGIFSSNLAPGIYGQHSWLGNNTTGVTEYPWSVAIEPITNKRLGINTSITLAVTTFRNDRSQVHALTASQATNSATKDHTQTVPLYIDGYILGVINPDLYRFCRSVLARNTEWEDPVSERKFICCGAGFLVGDLTDDTIYVGV